VSPFSLEPAKDARDLLPHVLVDARQVDQVGQIVGNIRALSEECRREPVPLALVGTHKAPKHVTSSRLDASEQRRELLVSHQATNRTTPSARGPAA